MVLSSLLDIFRKKISEAVVISSETGWGSAEENTESVYVYDIGLNP